jgi:hypothetical protein
MGSAGRGLPELAPELFPSCAGPPWLMGVTLATFGADAFLRDVLLRFFSEVLSAILLNSPK